MQLCYFVSGNSTVFNNTWGIFLYWAVLEPLGFRATLELVCFIRPVARCLPAKAWSKPLFSKDPRYSKYTAVMCNALLLLARITIVNNNSVHRIQWAKELQLAAYHQWSVWDSGSLTFLLRFLLSTMVDPSWSSSPPPCVVLLSGWASSYDLGLIFSFDIIWGYTSTQTNNTIHESCCSNINIPSCLWP